MKVDANTIARSHGAAALRKVIDGEAEARPPQWSDEALALLFADAHADDLRFVDSWGWWLRWNGEKWRRDDKLFALNCARRVCRQAAHQCGRPKMAHAIASSRTIMAVRNLARADTRLAATVEQWDSDDWLLNTPRGVVDLRTAESREHCSGDYITKITSVAPDPGCPIPLWLQFLDRITGGDAALIAFLKRVGGYALTGSIQEHALFFLYGTGANGKSTFLNALTGCAGDYHRTSAIETFTFSRNERHPTELAALRGARLVTAVETEEGRPWAESKIKSLTGGDLIAARFMRQDLFEFRPVFKLMIAGNHKPELRSVDEAIRRRFHLIPFVVTIPAAERDETLGEQLKREWPGILAWMIEGCSEWQEHGLAPPEKVQTATDEYLAAEDALAAWIEDTCELDPNHWESSPVLFKSWKSWAERNGEWVGSLKKFVQRLEDRSAALGIRKDRDGLGRRGFCGLRPTKPDLINSGPGTAP